MTSLRQDPEAVSRSQSWADLRNAVPDDDSHGDLQRCGSFPANHLFHNNRVGIDHVNFEVV